MNSRQYDRARELFLQARQYPPQDRLSFIKKAAGQDTELLNLVIELLDADDSETGFLNQPALGNDFNIAGRSDSSDASKRTTPDGNHPDTIGSYEVLGLIGRGGMGMVYKARQSNPSRNVAIKVVRSGLDSQDAIRRFQHEAQVLGRLNHPGIAKIFEAGATATTNQPWFAMELIEGEDLKTYLSNRSLSIREKLDLMARICDAVQHAHQQGVIHRDIKPANILVDSNGQPKILDFGVARLTDSDVQAVTIQTSIGQIVGTLTYMSPEQASGNPDKIDTRTDVYALGAVLYEMLTGQVPFDVHGKGIAEAARIILEEKPTPPGTLVTQLKGDIERILDKAMARDKAFRYPTTADLAADIRRHLNDEPIMARPPATSYLIRKFIKRHRRLVAGIVLVFSILTLSLVIVTVERNRALEAERLAASRLRESQAANQLAKERLLESQEANALAEKRLLESEEAFRQMLLVNDFIINMLRSPDPGREGKDVRVIDVLDKAAMTSQDYVDDSAVFGAITSALGTTYYGLGMLEQAEAQYRNALQAFAQATAGSGKERLSTMNNLAGILIQLNRPDDALLILRELLDKRMELYGVDHPDTRNAMNTLAQLEQKQGHVTEAIAIWEQLLESYRRTKDTNNEELSLILNNLGQIYSRNNRLAEAQPLLTESVELFKTTLGEENPDTLKAMSNLAQLHKRLKDFAKAEELHRHVVEVRRRQLGEHPDLYLSLNNLAMVLQEDNRLAEAEPPMKEALMGFNSLMGKKHPKVLTSTSNYANLLIDLDRADEAEPMLRELIENAKGTIPPNHWFNAIFRSNLGYCLTKLGQYEEAEQLLQSASSTMNEKFGPEDPRTTKIQKRLEDLRKAQSSTEK